MESSNISPVEISTKRGDSGTTQLGSRRVPKDDDVLELIGALDELQSCIGIAAYHCVYFKSKLLFLENLLYHIMAAIHRGEEIRLEETVESEQKELKGNLPTKFTLPYGSSAYIHLCRAIARRAERKAVRAKYGWVVPFLNRLSDLLYAYAFICAVKNGEVIYSKEYGRES